MSIVLATDVGTTSLKMAIVVDGETIFASAEQSYPMNVRPGGQRDIDTYQWWIAFLSCAKKISKHLGSVQALSFSVSTPGATAFSTEGEALTPAVLFLDGRSSREAQYIRNAVGEDFLLKHTSNLPVSGGCTASTILWWKEHAPEMFDHADYFGHTNTLFGKRLTGHWGTDPSTASLTGLYNTTENDGTWNEHICDRLGIPVIKLPPIVNSWEPVGTMLPQWSDTMGLPRDVPVLMGGNDAMCAALHGGVTHEGAILDICGTCEIICIGLSKSLPGRNYNVRCHVIPQLWSTLYVLNTGGKALEWFQQNFCRDMKPHVFYNQYLPKVLDEYLENEDIWEIPHYDVFLAGDRYSTEEKRAAFTGLTLDTTREKMLIAMIRENNLYMARHIQEMIGKTPLSHRVHLTGGGLSEAFIHCKRKWMGDFEYVHCNNSSLLGAAMLAHYHITGEKVWLKSQLKSQSEGVPQ